MSEIAINNGRSSANPESISLRLPPQSPLDMGDLARFFTSADAQSTPPPNPQEGDVYLDDGTNTKSGAMGFRWYHENEWKDIGLQDVTLAAIDGGTF